MTRLTQQDAMDSIDRWLVKIDRDLANPITGCWTWAGAIDKRNGEGYPQFWVRPGFNVKAHHIPWTLEYGQIPDGCEIDHECRNRLCVRPGEGHCVPVTHAENMRRAWAFRRGLKAA